MNVPSSYQVRVILHEESQDQHPDVHAVVISIGGDYDVVVTEVVKVVLDPEGGDEQVKLLILGHSLTALLIAVDRFATEAEHSLVVGVPYLRDRSGSGVSLSDEYAGLLGQILLVLRHLVAEVVATVAEFLVVDIGLLVPLTGLFLDARDLLTLRLGLLDLILNNRHKVQMDSEIVVQVACHEVIDK